MLLIKLCNAWQSPACNLPSLAETTTRLTVILRTGRVATLLLQCPLQTSPITPPLRGTLQPHYSSRYAAKVPIGYNGRPTFTPKITLPVDRSAASSLDPSDLPSQTASISDQSFCHNAPDRQTDRHRDQQMVGGKRR